MVLQVGGSSSLRDEGEKAGGFLTTRHMLAISSQARPGDGHGQHPDERRAE
jgi:hypothetical protein